MRCITPRDTSDAGAVQAAAAATGELDSDGEVDSDVDSDGDINQPRPTVALRPKSKAVKPECLTERFKEKPLNLLPTAIAQAHQ